MAHLTKNLKLLKYDTVQDGKIPFFIKEGLNNNWDKIDSNCITGRMAGLTSKVDISTDINTNIYKVSYTGDYSSVQPEVITENYTVSSSAPDISSDIYVTCGADIITEPNEPDNPEQYHDFYLNSNYDLCFAGFTYETGVKKLYKPLIQESNQFFTCVIVDSYDSVTICRLDWLYNPEYGGVMDRQHVRLDPTIQPTRVSNIDIDFPTYPFLVEFPTSNNLCLFGTITGKYRPAIYILYPIEGDEYDTGWINDSLFRVTSMKSGKTEETSGKFLVYSTAGILEINKNGTFQVLIDSSLTPSSTDISITSNVMQLTDLQIDDDGYEITDFELNEKEIILTKITEGIPEYYITIPDAGIEYQIPKVYPDENKIIIRGF